MAATAARLAQSVAPERPPSRAEQVLWAELLARQASFCFRLSRYAQARELLEQSLPILSDPAQSDRASRNSLAFALYYLGIIEETAGAYEEAQRWQRQSLQLYRENGNDWGTANVLNGLGNIAHSRGEYNEAHAFYGDSLRLRRHIGDRHGIALCLNNLGNVAQVMGNTVEAKQLFQESAALKEEIGDERGLAFSLNNLGYMAFRLQEYEEAGQQLQKSLALFREVGDRRGAAYSLTNLGNVAFDLGNYAGALDIYREALAIFEEISDRSGIAFCLEDLGNTSYALGDGPAAQAYYRQALQTAVAIPALPIALDILNSMANLLIEEGAYEKALQIILPVASQPFGHQQTRDRAEQLRQKVEAYLPATAVARARAESQSRPLDELLTMILAEK
jgi:tetratricopeptide (TPR) repeat protein